MRWNRLKAFIRALLVGQAVISCTSASQNDSSENTRIFDIFTSGSFDVSKIQYSDDYLQTLPTAKGNREWKCLRQAIYFEAGGESVKGLFGVGEVILNRKDHPAYPKTVCEVVEQRRGRVCQFSYICDGKPEALTNSFRARRAGQVARLLLDGGPREITKGALAFHNLSARPKWSRKMVKTAQIGGHIFYRPR